MKKTMAIIILFALALPVFAFVVSSDQLTSDYGVSYAERQRSNFIEKGDYSFKYMGNGRWNVEEIDSSADSNAPLIIFLLVIVGVIIIISVSVSNITTTVAKNSDMSEEDAKKVGKSAGVLAGTAASIGAAILLGKGGGVKPPERKHIYHHYN